jgi:hypothetical protein
MHAHRIHAVLSAVLITTISACANTVEDDFDHYEPEDTRDNVLFQGVYDCTETEDDGYRQGNRFDINVVRVDGRPVETNTANAYIAMQNAARNAGITLRIVSGFRTMDQQEYLYGCYTNCNCNSCNLAARPGYSNHQSGHALDLNTRDSGVLNWLNNHADEFGFRRTVPSEAWHWEWWGDASDFNGPCGGGSGSGGSDSSSSSDEAPSDCDTLPGEGGVIDDGDNCFVPGGPADYLRAVDQGHDGDSIWTGSTTHSSAVNFGDWWLKVSEPGRYRVEAYVDASLATSRQTKYSIRSALGNTSVTVDQTTSSGFRNLGEITLDPATPGRIRVGDNTGESGKRIVFDAIRLTKIEDSTCAHVRVETDGGPLNVRSSPSTSGTIRGTVGDGEVLVRTSSTSGQSVRGVTTWHQIEEGSVTGWVSGAYTVCVN